MTKATKQATSVAIYNESASNSAIDLENRHIIDVSKVSQKEIKEVVANYDDLKVGTVLFTAGKLLGWGEPTGLYRATRLTQYGLEAMWYLRLNITEPTRTGYCIRQYAIVKGAAEPVMITALTAAVKAGDYVLEDVVSGELFVVSSQRLRRDFEAVSAESAAYSSMTRDNDDVVYRLRSQS